MVVRLTATDLAGTMIGIRFRSDGPRRAGFCAERRPRFGTVEVCGYGRDAAAMEAVMEQVLGCVAKEPRWPQPNKCVYSARIRLSAFSRAVREMQREGSGLIVEQVRSLGRLIR